MAVSCERRPSTQSRTLAISLNSHAPKQAMRLLWQYLCPIKPSLYLLLYKMPPEPVQEISARKDQKPRASEKARAVVRACQQRRRTTEKVKAQEQAYRQTPGAKAKARARQQRRYQRMGGQGYRRHLLELIQRDGNRCGICGDALPEDRSQIHVDHKTPVYLGGSDDLSNLRACHAACNLGRTRDDYEVASVSCCPQSS